MQEIKSLCTNASIFPRNFGHHNPQNCNLKEYYEQLNAHAGRLFSNENDAALDFYYLEENGAGKSTPDFISHQGLTIDRFLGATYQQDVWVTRPSKVCQPDEDARSSMSIIVRLTYMYLSSKAHETQVHTCNPW